MWYKILLVMSSGLFIFAIGLIGYGILTGNILGDSDFGPGAYYYTDVPNFQKIFLEPPSMGFDHPIIVGVLFILWSLFVYKMWVLLNRRL